MYTHGSINLVVNEQNRRIREAQTIAQAYNRAERKPVNVFSRFRSMFSSPSRKESEQLAPAGEISRQGEAPC